MSHSIKKGVTGRQVSIIIGESMAIIRVRGALQESWAGCPVLRSGPINDPMELHEFLRGHSLYLFNLSSQV